MKPVEMHAWLGSGEMARLDCLLCKLEDLAPTFKSREGLGYMPSTGGWGQIPVKTVSLWLVQSGPCLKSVRQSDRGRHPTSCSGLSITSHICKMTHIPCANTSAHTHANIHP